MYVCIHALMYICMYYCTYACMHVASKLQELIHGPVLGSGSSGGDLGNAGIGEGEAT